MFSPSFLFASLIWGTVGFGYFIYGKKQSSWIPMTGGIIMILLSYFAPGALSMSLLSLFIITGIWYLVKSGY
jgi:hypothetical protein